MSCRCSWRDHLTKPLRVEVPWLYDDGATTVDATLSGLVYPDNSVDDIALTIDGGDEVALERGLRRQAESDLRMAADNLWRKVS